jgi:hypothetical protein
MFSGAAALPGQVTLRLDAPKYSSISKQRTTMMRFACQTQPGTSINRFNCLFFNDFYTLAQNMLYEARLVTHYLEGQR